MTVYSIYFVFPWVLQLSKWRLFTKVLITMRQLKQIVNWILVVKLAYILGLSATILEYHRLNVR